MLPALRNCRHAPTPSPLTRRLARAPAHRRASTTPKISPGKASALAGFKGPAAKADRLSKGMLHGDTPLARALQDTGGYHADLGAKRNLKDPDFKPKKKKDRPKVDNKRVHVVDEKLCDDILDYIGPSLQRHVGCDLVDMYPGAGLWSRKLSDVLKPRSHILMEPEDAFYRPFLEPLLSRPNTRLLPQSGIVWKELNDALANLENQTPQPREGNPDPQRNDTLLVTANLVWYPKKRFRHFTSAAQLVLYQLLNSIRTSQLFQRYGNVRLLLWTRPDDHRNTLARSIMMRRKSALEAEVTCEYMAEVAGPEIQERFRRDTWMDIESSARAQRQMKDAGMVIPKGRKMDLTLQAEPYISSAEPLSGRKPPIFKRPYHQELQNMERAHAEKPFSPQSQMRVRLAVLRSHLKRDAAEAEAFLPLAEEMEELTELWRSGSVPESELVARNEAWNAKVDKLSKHDKSDFRNYIAALHLMRQDPPVLLWDRRPYEPLKVNAKEFFPSFECSLLDIQPKATHPLLREVGGGTSGASELFDMIQRAMISPGMDPPRKTLERIAPGAADWIIPRCPSLHDPARGGTLGTGMREIATDMLNEKQWTEILEAFMEWPFRPTIHELIGRLTEDAEEETESGGGSNFSADAAMS
ncbi:hypothetical protein CMUS01_04595 [Colletotrichum musicola]|uniref:Mitochondrial transcription factor 1 n=1 Tax=Colletotrichum musicola TaxID=2175873 RepID=A0A8H6NMX8_9PEZI|nr:hypothetical protein CMUS01_04595 [Colletotrichum musicola]